MQSLCGLLEALRDDLALESKHPSYMARQLTHSHFAVPENSLLVSSQLIRECNKYGADKSMLARLRSNQRESLENHEKFICYFAAKLANAVKLLRDYEQSDKFDPEAWELLSQHLHGVACELCNQIKLHQKLN